MWRKIADGLRVKNREATEYVISSVREAVDRLLMNAANTYVEYENCGVRYRMIRYRQLRDYGLELDTTTEAPE